MILADTNILIYAHRAESPNHPKYRQWLEKMVSGDEAYGVFDLVLSSFIRIVTNPKIYNEPTPLDIALTFVEKLRDVPHAVNVAPGPRHWKIFTDLCQKASAKGNLIPDAYLAALAIETGSEWITDDRDFSRFPGLRWRHPLE